MLGNMILASKALSAKEAVKCWRNLTVVMLRPKVSLCRILPCEGSVAVMYGATYAFKLDRVMLTRSKLRQSIVWCQNIIQVPVEDRIDLQNRCVMIRVKAKTNNEARLEFICTNDKLA
jgi:hypothetical protein